VSAERLVPIEQAAEFLGVPTSWLYDQAARGKVPSYKVGKYRRFRVSELEAWISTRREGDPLVTSHGGDGNSR
jgi:PTS system nitrogen regulatory IIA component